MDRVRVDKSVERGDAVADAQDAVRDDLHVGQGRIPAFGHQVYRVPEIDPRGFQFVGLTQVLRHSTLQIGDGYPLTVDLGTPPDVLEIEPGRGGWDSGITGRVDVGGRRGEGGEDVAGDGGRRDVVLVADDDPSGVGGEDLD